jgi:hypothetical protein
MKSHSEKWRKSVQSFSMIKKVAEKSQNFPGSSELTMNPQGATGVSEE